MEAAEHLQAISSLLLELEKNPTPEQKAEKIEAIFRHAHSLKGAARAINFGEIETICQSLENVFSNWKRQGTHATAEAFDTLHRAVDLISYFALGSDSKGAASDPRAIFENDRRAWRIASVEIERFCTRQRREGILLPETATPATPMSEPKASQHNIQARVGPAAAVQTTGSEPRGRASPYRGWRTSLRRQMKRFRISTTKLDLRLLLEDGKKC